MSINNRLINTGGAFSGYADGQFQIAVQNSYVKTSTDFGVTWTSGFPTGVSGNVRAVDISGTGQYVVMGGTDGTFYSSDFGQTFVNRGASFYAEAGLYVSDDGQIILRVGGDSNKTFVSTNAGVSWTTISLPAHPVSKWGVAMSSNGQYMAVSARQYAIYYSQNYGATWNERLGGNIDGIGMSPDGSKIYAAGYNGNESIFSSNYGTTWTGVGFNSDFQGTTVKLSNSANTRIFLSQYVQVSGVNNFTFTQNFPLSSNSRGGAISYSGQYITTMTSDQKIYTSQDYGVTWGWQNANYAQFDVAFAMNRLVP